MFSFALVIYMYMADGTVMTSPPFFHNSIESCQICSQKIKQDYSNIQGVQKIDTMCVISPKFNPHSQFNY